MPENTPPPPRDSKAPPKCGDYGGKTLKQSPCTHEAGWGTDHEGQGRCSEHDLEAEAALQALKKRFVELFATGQISLRESAKRVGVGPSQILRYRKADSGFDSAVKQAQESCDTVRVGLVEDVVFQRITNGTASPAETIFFMVNRGRGRWRHIQTIEHAGDPDHPIQVRHKDGDLEELTTVEKLERLKGIIAGYITPAGSSSNGGKRANGGKKAG